MDLSMLSDVSRLLAYAFKVLLYSITIVSLRRRRRHFGMSAIYHHRIPFGVGANQWLNGIPLKISCSGFVVTDSPTYQHVVSIVLRMRRREFFSCLVMKKPNRATQEMHHEMLQITFYVSAQLEIPRHNPAPPKMLSGRETGPGRCKQWVIFESDRKWDCGILDLTSFLSVGGRQKPTTEQPEMLLREF